MAFFQNPFPYDFKGSLLLADRAHIPSFNCSGNKGRGDEIVVAWKNDPYNMNGNDVAGNDKSTLTIKYAFDSQNFMNWAPLAIDVASTATSDAAVTKKNVVDALNANTTFASLFTATVDYQQNAQPLVIRQKQQATRFRFYIANTGAETVVGFNQKATVVELPSYFARHTTANANVGTFPDCVNMLVQLSPADAVDSAVITAAGLTPGSPKADYQLMQGRSGLFMFQKLTVDSSDRITQIIEYPAGAVAGDFARKIKYTYTAAKTKPDQITEEPYTLVSADLVVP
jgi:hypothetical protein